MKDDTPGLVKFRSLKKLLSLRDWQVVGILESLWLFARKNASMGDVGRFSNLDIAAAIEWDGDADKLIHALTVSRWLVEVSGESRLVCNDWVDHAPDFVLRRMAKKLGLPDSKTPTSAIRDAWRVKMFGRKTTDKPPDRGDDRPATRPPGAENGVETAPLACTREPNPTQPNQAHPHQSDSWKAVVEDLLKFGVSKAAEAVASAKQAGCNINQVRNLIEFWRARQPAWGAGALYERLIRFRPDQGFDQLWPPSVTEGYHQVSAEEFRDMLRMKKFKDKPQRHATNPTWFFGTLRDGRKVECRNYRPPSALQPSEKRI